MTTRWVGLPGYLDQNYNTNFFIPLPKHQLEDIPLEDLFEADVSARHPLGWGAYEIEEWVPGDKIRLRKNPHYFRADEGLPRFDQLVFRFVGEDNEKNLESIRSGECDFLDLKASTYPEAIESSDFLTYEAEQQIDLHYSPATVWEHLDSNLQQADSDDGYQVGADRADFCGHHMDPTAKSDSWNIEEFGFLGGLLNNGDTRITIISYEIVNYLLPNASKPKKSSRQED